MDLNRALAAVIKELVKTRMRCLGEVTTEEEKKDGVELGPEDWEGRGNGSDVPKYLR